MRPKNNYTIIQQTCAALATGLGFACLATSARSQDAGMQGFHELDAVVAVANRMEMPVQHVGSSVEVYDAFELRDGQETFLLDSLRSVPGFYFRNNGGPGGTFGMTTRGLSSNRPTVLLNGIEVSNPSSGQMINLGNLFSGPLERVEILKGPQSSLYGADALAGVISIETLAPGGENGGRAAFSYGSYETYDYSIGHSGSRGGLSWSLDAQQYESEGFSAQDPAYGPEWADDDGYDNTSLSSAFSYSLSDDMRLFLSAYYTDAYSEFDPGDPAWVWGTPASDNYSVNEQLFTRAGADFRVSERWKSTASFAYSNVNSLSYSDDNNASASDAYRTNGDRYLLDWQNTVELGESWRLVAGVESELEDNRSDVGDRENNSLYFENVLRASEALDLTLGARHDDNSVYGGETTYRATFSYRLADPETRVRGSYGSSFQAPTFYQLFNASYGNLDLKPESGEGWDLGVEKSFNDGRVFVSATLFGNDVTDKIAWNNRYMNLDRYESRGLETSVRYYVSDSLRLSASHTYSDAEENGVVEALRVPRNIGSIGLHWTGIDGKLSVDAQGYFVSSQYGDGGQRSSGEKMDGYSVFNLAASYQLGESYSVWARIGNVFDEEYQEIPGYQTAGANAQAGVRLTF